MLACLQYNYLSGQRNRSVLRCLLKVSSTVSCDLSATGKVFYMTDSKTRHLWYCVYPFSTVLYLTIMLVASALWRWCFNYYSHLSTSFPGQAG